MTRRLRMGAVLVALPLLSLPGFAADKGKRIAIMPFDNTTKDKAVDWIGGGIAETLITELGRIPDLTLIERTRLNDALKEMKLGQSGAVDAATAPKIGKILGADSVVVGSFQKVGSTLRLLARLVDVQTAQVRDTAKVDGNPDDLLALQDQLAARLLASIKGTVAAAERERLGVSPSTNLDALRALSDGVKFYRLDLFQDAAASFDKALALDPNYVDAQYYKGLALGKLKRWDEAIESLKRTLPRAEAEQRVKWTWQAPFDVPGSPRRAYPALDTTGLNQQALLSAESMVDAQRRVVFSEQNGSKTVFYIVDPVRHASTRLELPERIVDQGIAFATNKLTVITSFTAASLLSRKFGLYGISAADGSVLWHMEASLGQGLQLPMFGLTDGILWKYSVPDHQVTAMDDTTLQPKWQRDNLDLEIMPPSVKTTRAFGNVLIAKSPSGRKIHGIRFSDGQDAWAIDLQTDKTYHRVSDKAVVVFEPERRVFAVDPETGRTLMDVPVKPLIQTKVFRVLGTFPEAPSAVLEGILYLVSEAREIVAVDMAPNVLAEKRIRWKTAPQKEIRDLAAHGSRVYASTEDGELLVADAQSGNPVVSKKVSNKPLDLNYVGGDVLVASSDEAVLGLNPETGAKEWDYPSSVRTKPPLYFKGIVLIETSGTTHLTALDADNGSLLWQFTGGLAENGLIGIFAGGTPSVHFGGDSLFIIQPNGLQEYALDKAPSHGITNKDAYTELANALLSKGDLEEAGRFAKLAADVDANYPPLRLLQSRMAQAQGRTSTALYELGAYADLIGRQSRAAQDILAGFKRDQGVIWNTEMGAAFFGPLLMDGKLFVSNRKQLLALDPANGKVLWRHSGDPIYDCVYDPKSRRMFYATGQSRDPRTVQIYVVDIDKGERKEFARLAFASAGGRLGVLAYAKERLFVGLATGDVQEGQKITVRIAAFNGVSGARLWENNHEEAGLISLLNRQSIGLFYPKGDFFVYSFGRYLWIIRSDDGSIYDHRDEETEIISRIAQRDDEFAPADLLYFGTRPSSIAGYKISTKQIVLRSEIPHQAPDYVPRATFIRDNTLFDVDGGSIFAFDLTPESADAERVKWRTAEREGYFFGLSPAPNSANLWATRDEVIGALVDPSQRKILNEYLLIWYASAVVDGERRYGFTPDGLGFAMRLKPISK